MGKWAARLAELLPVSRAEEISTPPLPDTDKTDATPVLSVLAVPRGGDTANFQPAANESRTCAGCTHRLPRGTCVEPEAAGLFPPGHGFGIAWPGEGHAESCAAFAPREPLEAQAGRPYRLTRAEADEAHAEPWQDAAIGLFNDRTDALRRLGFVGDDPDDLAERLHLRDVRGDDRRACVECLHLRPRPWRCGNHQAAAVARELAAELVTTFQDCPGFNPAR
ncbi:MAG: hypothetical protein IPM99_12680 [Rubrivivax sp.]|nr:hypothetical protein [Rubrivivax sp.]